MAGAPAARRSKAGRPAVREAREQAEQEMQLELVAPANPARGMQERDGNMIWLYAAPVAQECRSRNLTPVSRPEIFTQSRIQAALVCLTGA